MRVHTLGRLASGAIVARRNFCCSPAAWYTGMNSATVAGLVYSPVGTLALMGVCYNVSVVGLKHFWYTLEMVSKDYCQDPLTQLAVRYMVLMVLLIAVEMLFVEN